MLAKKLFLEAVTVCVNYADFLEETIPHNLPQLDLWTVVTTPEDERTQGVCARYGLRCLKTECFYRDVERPSINKSRGINYGLAHQSHSGWMLHLDSDIVLPPQFRKMVENAELDPACLYGMDRVNCTGSAAWDAFRHDPELQYEWSCLVKPPRGWRLGARIAHGDYGGYCPIGFFQLWNPRGSGVNRYPMTVEGNMEHTDVLFAIQWPRARRHLLPEGFCVHLESSGEFGANWHGRKTPPFRGMPGPGLSSTQGPTAADRSRKPVTY
jgi:hypothetical protein